MEPKVKPGWQTSEFWTTGIINVIALLVLAGVIDPGDQSAIAEAATQAIAGTVIVLNQVAFIWSRAIVKKAATEPPVDG